MSNADAFDRTGKIAVQQNIQGTLDFLKKSPPFNLMDVSHLAYMVENCKLRFYAAGESIIKPEEGPVEYFFVVKQGLVTGKRSTVQSGDGENTFEISSGECFPLAALLGERATRTEHLAAQDTFCLLLPKAAFVRLFSTCNSFRDFCLRGVSSLLDQVNQQVQQRAAESLGSQYSL
jgi:CBS domain-containing protein